MPQMLRLFVGVPTLIGWVALAGCAALGVDTAEAEPQIVAPMAPATHVPTLFVDLTRGAAGVPIPFALPTVPPSNVESRQVDLSPGASSQALIAGGAGTPLPASPRPPASP